MKDSTMNPLGNLYSSFGIILKNLTIKYVSKAEKFETLETKMAADGYLSALNKEDSFDTYSDYTSKEMQAVGCNSMIIQKEVLSGDTSNVPERYKQPLLDLRRKREIDSYIEKNNYYRNLNGYPDLEDTDIFYPPNYFIEEYGLKKMPIHEIQDYYNKKNDKMGDYYISILEGTKYIDNLIKKYPEKTYLKYLGENRISINTARRAKNFEIIQLKRSDIVHTLYDHFLQIYESCREYFVKTIYVYNYNSFIDYYDNFIAMSIMVMTIQQLVMRQISFGIKRDFFDVYTVRALYETYNVPYNLNIDDDTQSDIIQNLNILIQDKSTNKVIYNIANLLGFSNINVYKYYIMKERKYDNYGVPIVAFTEKFNNDTGEMETIPDYKKMYDLYFQKSELKEEDFVRSFNNLTNKVEYSMTTESDPYWWEDEKVYSRIWNTEYNFVESKYLSLGVSYSLTQIMYENILFLKIIMEKEEYLKTLQIKLPKITGDDSIPIFDAIILLVCLTAAKHNLCGEIITIPTQVTSVLDYMRNINQTNMLVDTLSFNFKYFDISNKESNMNIEKMRSILGDSDYAKFKDYVTKLSFENLGNEDKTQILNRVFGNIKNIQKLLTYALTIAPDRKSYEMIKTMYDAVFYSRELRSVFTIKGERTSVERTAWSYFEFLYHKNPKLYSEIFVLDENIQYIEYLKNNKLKEEDLSFNDFMCECEKGNIKLNFDTVKNHESVDSTESDKDNVIYFYVNHIISRLELFIDNLNFLYTMNDSSTPLEDLLIKLIRFFKSYTVDIVGLDTLFICDLKEQNIIKLFDEIKLCKKDIGMNEELRLQYSDVLNTMTAIISTVDEAKLRDSYELISNIYVTKDSGNNMYLTDEVNTTDKTIDLNKSECLNIIDTTKINSSFILNDAMKFGDKIVKMWYSD